MNDLREEIGKQFRLTRRIVRNWMMWAGHLVRMEESRKSEVTGKGGPLLGWEKQGGGKVEGKVADREQ